MHSVQEAIGNVNNFRDGEETGMQADPAAEGNREKGMMSARDDLCLQQVGNSERSPVPDSKKSSSSSQRNGRAAASLVTAAGLLPEPTQNMVLTRLVPADPQWAELFKKREISRFVARSKMNKEH